MIKILINQDTITVIKKKHLLLDTCVFIDSSLNSSAFIDFIGKLKNNSVNLTTIDLVKFEFLKGATDIERYQEKEQMINKIIDYTIPITQDLYQNSYELIKQYKLSGKALSETDFLLGACLMKYRKNLFLLTKNTTDFPTNIFNLVSVINIVYTKGVHFYGLYNYL